MSIAEKFFLLQNLFNAKPHGLNNMRIDELKKICFPRSQVLAARNRVVGKPLLYFFHQPEEIFETELHKDRKIRFLIKLNN